MHWLSFIAGWCSGLIALATLIGLMAMRSVPPRKLRQLDQRDPAWYDKEDDADEFEPILTSQEETMIGLYERHPSTHSDQYLPPESFR